MAGMNFTLDTELGPLDLLGEVSDVGTYDDFAKTAVLQELEGRKLKIASLESLIDSKRAAARTKDKLVLPELEALLEIKRKLEER